jgi:transcriptional regulator with XRE-family HTH domain
MERTDVAKELGHFLRTRRERLGPDGCTGGRRTQGLRREEVAEKAAVSREYYTKLEQGRALNPSLEVLESVASALRLSNDEVMYVQDLAALLKGAGFPEGPEPDEAPDSVGERLVDAIRDRPAWVVDHRLDITSWNEIAAEMLVDFATLPPHQRNLSWLVFTNPQVRSRCVQWGEVARQNVALLRGGAGRHPNDRRMVELVGALSMRSNSFARLWASHDVLGRNHGTRIFEHPLAGQYELHYDAVRLPGPFERHLTVYSARERVGEQALSVMRSICEARQRHEVGQAHEESRQINSSE